MKSNSRGSIGSGREVTLNAPAPGPVISGEERVSAVAPPSLFTTTKSSTAAKSTALPKLSNGCMLTTGSWTFTDKPASTERIRMPASIGGLFPVTLETDRVRVVSPVAGNLTSALSLAPPLPMTGVPTLSTAPLNGIAPMVVPERAPRLRARSTSPTDARIVPGVEFASIASTPSATTAERTVWAPNNSVTSKRLKRVNDLRDITAEG